MQTGDSKHRKQGGGGEKRKWRKGKAEEVKLVFSRELWPHKELSLLLSGTQLAATAWPSAYMGDTCSFGTLSPHKGPLPCKALGQENIYNLIQGPLPDPQKPHVTSPGDIEAQLSRKTLSCTFQVRH